MSTLPYEIELPSVQTKRVPHARILMIEDDDDTRYGVQIQLQAEGFEVYLTDRGNNSVALAQHLKPDLVLLDLGLPGMDGMFVLRNLSLVLPKVPVIVVSARAEATHERPAMTAGASLYLQKPVEGDLLLQVIRDVLTPS